MATKWEVGMATVHGKIKTGRPNQFPTPSPFFLLLPSLTHCQPHHALLPLKSELLSAFKCHSCLYFVLSVGPNESSNEFLGTSIPVADLKRVLECYHIVAVLSHRSIPTSPQTSSWGPRSPLRTWNEFLSAIRCGPETSSWVLSHRRSAITSQCYHIAVSQRVLKRVLEDLDPRCGPETSSWVLSVADLKRVLECYHIAVVLSHRSIAVLES
jgi:hypothetical protein